MTTSRYVEDAEAFLARLNEEHFLHGAGLKETLDLSTIYQAYGSLFEMDAVAKLLSDRDGREGRYLAHFGACGFVENRTREITERLAAAETQATIEWDGEAVPYRTARVLVSNEPDLSRRRELERRIVEATDCFNPDYAVHLAESHAAAADLSFPDYATMSDELAGLNLTVLLEQTERLLADTAEVYRAMLGPRLRLAGVEPSDATTGDLGFARRAPEFDAIFPKQKLLAALEVTLAGLGIALGEQENVTLDIEERPLKSPRAFCAPVRVPKDVRLAIRPRGGYDDYVTLFHECGHLEHFANTNAAAPLAFRCLGDNSVTECYAFLLGKLPATPAWLDEVMGQSEAGAYVSLARLVDLHFVRRYAAKLAYELALHRGAPLDGLRELYAELLGNALSVRVWPEYYLYDVDDFFYCACYLRAWMLEVQLRHTLVDEFGPRWFASPAAGRMLTDLWALGQELTADEIAQRLGWPGLQVEALIEDLVRGDAAG